MMLQVFDSNEYGTISLEVIHVCGLTKKKMLPK